MNDEEAVRSANQAFYRAIESLELLQMDAIWAHDGQVFCIHPGWPLASGWDAVRRSWRTIFANTESIRFDVTDEEIDVRGDMAWVLCIEWLGAGQGAAIVATNIFRRGSDGWKLVQHHASPLVSDPTRGRPDGRPSFAGKRGPLN